MPELSCEAVSYPQEAVSYRTVARIGVAGRFRGLLTVSYRRPVRTMTLTRGAPREKIVRPTDRKGTA